FIAAERTIFAPSPTGSAKPLKSKLCGPTIELLKIPSATESLVRCSWKLPPATAASKPPYMPCRYTIWPGTPVITTVPLAGLLIVTRLFGDSQGAVDACGEPMPVPGGVGDAQKVTCAFSVATATGCTRPGGASQRIRQ